MQMKSGIRPEKKGWMPRTKAAVPVECRQNQRTHIQSGPVLHNHLLSLHFSHGPSIFLTAGNILDSRYCRKQRRVSEIFSPNGPLEGICVDRVMACTNGQPILFRVQGFKRSCFLRGGFLSPSLPVMFFMPSTQDSSPQPFLILSSEN